MTARGEHRVQRSFSMPVIAHRDSMRGMELRQLEYFVAVADEMSFTRAAQRVHVVQSALSTSVKKLEEELDVALFDRSRQQIRLTPAGEELRHHARGLLRAARLAKDALTEYRGRLTGTVDFGSLVTFGRLDVPKVLGEFHAAHPFVRMSLRLSQIGSSAYLTSIVDGALDLALVSAPHRFPVGVDTDLLAEEPMLFACRPDHRLAGRKRVALRDLADEPMVGFPEGFGIRRLVDEAFAEAGVMPRTLYEVPGDYTAWAALVRNGLGTAFMPMSEVRRFDGLLGLELTEPIIWRIYLARPTPDRIGPAAARLADMLVEAARAV